MEKIHTITHLASGESFDLVCDDFQAQQAPKKGFKVTPQKTVVIVHDENQVTYRTVLRRATASEVALYESVMRAGLSDSNMFDILDATPDYIKGEGVSEDLRGLKICIV